VENLAHPAQEMTESRKFSSSALRMLSDAEIKVDIQ
jgi:hypothetical protein